MQIVQEVARGASILAHYHLGLTHLATNPERMTMTMIEPLMFILGTSLRHRMLLTREQLKTR